MDTRRVAIITDDPGWHGTQLTRAFAARSVHAEYVSLKMCALVMNENSLPINMPGFSQKLPDAVFVRGVPGGTLEEVIFYLDILHALKIIGIPVYNDAYAIEKSVDKAMTSFLLGHAKITTPATWVVSLREKALKVVEQELIAGKMVMSKPLFGSQGEGIRRLEKMLDLFWLTSSRGIYYLQRYVPCEGNEYSDIRVFVIHNKAVAAMRRKGLSWLNNVARGGHCESIEIDDELSELAIKATQTLQMDYAGVDIIKDEFGCYTVIEINSIPAWKGLQGVCDINVAQLMVDDLLTRYLGVNCSAKENCDL